MNTPTVVLTQTATAAPATETPTQAIIKTASDTAFKVDSKGRKIVVRRISLLNSFRVSKLLGSFSENNVALAMAQISAAVCEIDGEIISLPMTERELEFTMQRLDNEGFAAAAEALKTLNPEEGIDAAKN